MEKNTAITTWSENPQWSTAHLNKFNVFYFVALHVIAGTLAYVYIQREGFRLTDMVSLLFMFTATCMSITGGYHRLFSHRSYQCNRVVKFLYLVFGAAAIQNSAYIWASNHRYHHRFVDKEGDPYNIGKGFFWAHMGWMLYRDPPERTYDNALDLQKDRLVQWEHRYYLWIAIITGITVPVLIGAAFGRPFGGLVWGGLVRLVLGYHNTFFINSAAHWFGPRPYNGENTARECWLIPTAFGEGHHNYHHLFASDYRNGERWFHWDPTKWLINGLSRVGLAWNLQRVPRWMIERAKIRRRLEIAVEKAQLKAEKRGWQLPVAVVQRAEAAKLRLEEINHSLALARTAYIKWKTTERLRLPHIDRKAIQAQWSSQIRARREEWNQSWRHYRSLLRQIHQQLV